MAEPLVLNETVSEPLMPLALVLDEVVPIFTASKSGRVYWRWEDDSTKEPQFLGSITAGYELATPFDLKGKQIRLFIVAKTDTGTESVKNIKEAEQIVFSPGPESETEMQAGSFEINLNITAEQVMYQATGTQEFILTYLVLRDPSEILSSSANTITFKDADGITIYTVNLNNFTAIDTYLIKRIPEILQPIFKPGDQLKCQASAALGVYGTLWADIYGYFRDVDESLTDLGEGLIDEGDVLIDT